jgi:O-antigen biosynthesis protein
VAVGPWRAGSGMQPWTVEALAWGIPLVTTPAGAEGVPLVADRDAVVVDDADAMARAVLELITDHARWAALSESGQAVVRAHLEPAVVASRLTGLLEPVAARTSR